MNHALTYLVAHHILIVKNKIFMKKIIVLGGGGHCKSCIDVIENENKYKIIGIVDKKKNFLLNYKVFKDRTKSSFELFDSIQSDNIYRVYPHKLFCDTTIKNRCVTHDDKNIFYADEDHPSFKGAEIINDLIMKEINKIK